MNVTYNTFDSGYVLTIYQNKIYCLADISGIIWIVKVQDYEI